MPACARCVSQAAPASPQGPAKRPLSMTELPVPAALASVWGLTVLQTQPKEGGTAFTYRGRSWWCAHQGQVGLRLGGLVSTKRRGLHLPRRRLGVRVLWRGLVSVTVWNRADVNGAARPLHFVATAGGTYGQSRGPGLRLRAWSSVDCC